ncbi:MAG: hypothetical protein WC564_00265 [Patescibacteria group bacterium]
MDPYILVSTILMFLFILRYLAKNKVYQVRINGQIKKMTIRTWGQVSWDKNSTNLGSADDLAELYKRYPGITRRSPIVATYNWAREGNFKYLLSNGKFQTAFLSTELNKRKFRYLMLVEK